MRLSCDDFVLARMFRFLRLFLYINLRGSVWIIEKHFKLFILPYPDQYFNLDFLVRNAVLQGDASFLNRGNHTAAFRTI